MICGDSGEWPTFMSSLKEKAIAIPLIKEVIDKVPESELNQWVVNVC